MKDIVHVWNREHIWCYLPHSQNIQVLESRGGSGLFATEPIDSVIEFLLPIPTTLSSACLEFLVPKEELLTRGRSHPGLQVKNPNQRGPLPDFTEKKSVTDVSVKNPGEGQPLKGPRVWKIHSGQYWKSFDSVKFIQQERHQPCILIFIYLFIWMERRVRVLRSVEMDKRFPGLWSTWRYN